MKVIIVEDEPRVRKGLSEAVDWESMGMSLVGTASNGLEGLEMFRQLAPELVIADIRMPVMDGLAMTDAILEQSPETKIVIISGHDEFEYAQRCIAYGVDSYLLKPIGKQQLRAELEKIMKSWKSDRALRERTEQFEHKLKLQLPQLRTAFLEEWLGAAAVKELDALKDSFSFLHLPLDLDSPAAVAIFELDLDSGAYTERDRRLLEFAMNNILEELLRDNGIAYQRGNGQTVVLFQTVSSDVAEDLLQWADQSMDKAGRLMNRGITVAVGSRSVPVVQLPHMFQEAQRMLGLKLSLGTGIILHEGMIRPVRESLAVLHEADEALLTHGVEMNDREEIERVIEVHFDKWMERKEAGFPDEIFYQFTGLFTKLAHRLGRSVHEYMRDDNRKLWRHPEYFRSMEDMKLWWVSRFAELSDSYEGFRSDRKTKLIQQVIQYIDDHIYENLTREDAANHVYINSSYLSRLFKEVTGESFSDYVLSRKMQQAIHLLQVERVMVYEVADRLGYKDPSYFARVFKKMTGKSPSEFQ